MAHLDPTNMEKAALRAYEQSRAVSALWQGIAVFAFGSLLCGVTGRVDTRLVAGLLGVALLYAFLLYMGQALGAGAKKGIWIGLIPIGGALLMECSPDRWSHTMCAQICATFAVLSGTAGGVWVGRGLSRAAHRTKFLLGAGSVALLATALGCISTGFGSILGVSLGLSLGTLPSLIVYRAPRWTDH